MIVVAASRLHFYAVGSKESVSHLKFHREIATVAMKIGFHVSRKGIRDFIAPVSMNIISSFSSCWL